MEKKKSSNYSVGQLRRNDEKWIILYEGPPQYPSWGKGNESQKHKELVLKAKKLLLDQGFSEDRIKEGYVVEFKLIDDQEKKKLLKKADEIQSRIDKIRRKINALEREIAVLHRKRKKILKQLGPRIYVIDIVGISDKRRVAIECGYVSKEKILVLQDLFDEVIRLPYVKNND